MKYSPPKPHNDVILIGTGIMSATLGTRLRQLEPQWTIRILERLDKVSIESSEAWNNAGTGHSTFCELNYTPEQEDGSIQIKKAVQIASSLEVSKEFWVSLVGQVTQSQEDRMEALHEYFPLAQAEDWNWPQAGQRVQVIKKDVEEGGVLEFGTGVVYAADGSLATLLGASPGASTSVSIMLDVLQKCFPEQGATPAWK